MTDNVIELNRHHPSVESVVSRLVRHTDKIEHIVVGVLWKKDFGNADVFCNTQDMQSSAYLAMLIMDDYFRALRPKDERD